jgi:hypothetical protein
MIDDDNWFLNNYIADFGRLDSVIVAIGKRLHSMNETERAALSSHPQICSIILLSHDARLLRLGAAFFSS